MQESYEKGLANRSAPTPTLATVTSRVWHGQGVHAGQVLSVDWSPKSPLWRAHAVLTVEGNTRHDDSWPVVPRRGGVVDPVHVWGNSRRENREILLVSVRASGMFTAWAERSENVTGGTTDMNADRNSDESVVPATSANNDAAEASAESIEERDSAKRNAEQA